MTELQFRGYSDDTFGEYLLTNIDSDNCGSGKPISFEVSAGGEALIVTGRYGVSLDYLTGRSDSYNMN